MGEKVCNLTKNGGGTGNVTEYNLGVTGCYLYKVGKEVSFQTVDSVSLPSSTTIPSGFRPKNEISAPCMAVKNNSWHSGWVRVLTDGSIKFFTVDAGEITGNVQLSINASWLTQ